MKDFIIEKETIEVIKKKIKEMYPRMKDEDMDKYIQAFLKEEYIQKQMVNFVCSCKVNKRKI